MHGEKLPTEDQFLLLQLARALSKHEDTILKDVQKKFCGSCHGGALLVYRSPEAYEIGRILSTLKMRGAI